VLLEIEPGGVISVSPDSENSLKVLGDGDVEFSRARGSSVGDYTVVTKEVEEAIREQGEILWEGGGATDFVTGSTLELSTEPPVKFDELAPSGAQERPDPTDLGAASTDWETSIEWAPQAYMSISPAREFVIYDDDGSVLVSINPSQHTVFFGKRYSPEGAAREFWEIIAKTSPVINDE